MSETVLVTGISGFIAKHVALALLGKGYQVRGTVRSLSRQEEVRAAMAEQRQDLDRLHFVQVDLTSDEGWDEALRGVDFVQHLASPFPMAQPKDRFALVPEAREGTLRVLNAAAREEVDRVVVTSSVAAMMYRPRRPDRFPIREGDWTDVEWERLSPYVVSKAKAEEAVWEWAEAQGWKDRVTVVNPALVLGPLLDKESSTSVDVVKLLMEGAYPASPPVAFAVVDVRDVAELHVAAMTAPETPGRRLLAASDTLGMAEMGQILRSAYPEMAKQIPVRTLPGFLIRFASRFDGNLKAVLPDLSVRPEAENAYVTELTGVSFRPAREALLASAASLLAHGLVKPKT